ncbi:hypothetical protein CHS0354_040922 [Potamilus streckersoni]|uniref:Beta-lactamase-related domain-containing protein n=1 Tax=Potamilus streckersoni TaxID=2493646 RepID=A0AAE0SLX2_9BIVA|nr:hypothetical protein CHS0354_040922 [Potamilus streckersoni]
MAKRILIDGFVKPGFEHVLETFRSNLSSGLEKGGSFAAYYRGQLVVHIWGGYCDFDSRRPWKKDTLSCFFSSTKAICAFVIAHLVDRGHLDYSEKVSKYWPEFAQNGKENITLEQLVSLQAGLVTLDDYKLSEIRDDPKGLEKKLAAQKPFWNPGEAFGYHPLTFALYLDQVVSHADPKHRNIAQYFKEEMANPFDIEFYIGLPKHLHYRAARVVLTRKMDLEQLAKHFKGDLNLFMETAKNPKDFHDVRRINDPDCAELPVGSSHGFGGADAMAKLCGILANGGEHEGKLLLSRELIRKFEKPIVKGYDINYGLDHWWSLGTTLFGVKEGNEPVKFIFGHGGFGGQWVGVDTHYKVGYAYTTGFCDAAASYNGIADQRLDSLYHTIYDCIRRIENVILPRINYFLYSQYEKATNAKNKL